jgi:uncharacterized protein YbjT (DUF2867 family)
MKVLVTGASGFVGSHTVEALIGAGHEVVGFSRSLPKGERNKAKATYRTGVDVANAESFSIEDFADIDAVVHLVGIIAERRPSQTFQRIHVDGTRNIVNAAKTAGVSRIVYLSAIGSSPDSPSEYSRTKAAAEKFVSESGVDFVILRPSIILGKDGEFVAQMRDLALHGGLPLPMRIPFAPIPGTGKTLFQPIWVDDLTQVIIKSVADKTVVGKTIEIGGATQLSFDAIVDGIAVREGARPIKVHLPVALLSLVAPLVELTPNPPFTGDQLKNLSRDNITDIGPMKTAFEIDPIGFDQSMDLIYAK